jgi:hypothetical protein
MVLFPHLLSALACTVLCPVVRTVSARQIDRNHIKAVQRGATHRFNENRLAVPLAGDVQPSPGVKNFTFSNPAASGECRTSSRNKTVNGVLTVC